MTAGLEQQIGYLSGTGRGPDIRQAARCNRHFGPPWWVPLILARMTNDSDLSDEILNETRAWLAAQNRKKTKTRRG